MVSTTTCVSINAYMNVPWFTFLKGPLAQVQLCVLSPKSLIDFSLCHVKCLTWGSRLVEPFLSFSTSLWLDEVLV